MNIEKTLQRSDELYLQFTDEELKKLGIEKGQKFSVKTNDDGSIELVKWKNIEVNIEEWPREVLEAIIKESCEKDISANDVINSMIKEGLEKLERKNKQ